MAQQKLSYLNLYTTDPAWNLAAIQKRPKGRIFYSPYY